MKNFKLLLLTSFMLFGILNLYAQQDADISKMNHSKLRKHLKENGFKTANGTIVNVGDEFILGKGTMTDKRFVFLFQDPTRPFSKSSGDLTEKAYLHSAATGRKATVTSFMTHGMKKGNYSIFVVVNVGEPIPYWVEFDSAVEAGEIKLPE